METAPLLPRLKKGTVRRWKHAGSWVRPETEFLCRHLRDHDGKRIVTNDPDPPPGYRLEYYLGTINRFSAPGTALLRTTSDGFEVAPDATGTLEDDGVLGFVELAPLPMLDSLVLARSADTGQTVLVCGPEDPIAAAEGLGTLGYIESYPLNPRNGPSSFLPYGVRGIVRSVDRSKRRHVYGIDRVPDAELVGELGAALDQPPEAGVALWVTADGRLVTDRYEPGAGRPSMGTVARWILAPLAWRGFATPRTRLRSAVKRALEAPRHIVLPRHPPKRPDGPPAGYLYVEARHDQNLPLYSATHPVTRDQLLTTYPLMAADMGYGPAILLGYMSPQSPLTGEISLRRTSIPWASRFGQVVRRA
jgi:hypothetical protein